MGWRGWIGTQVATAVALTTAVAAIYHFNSWQGLHLALCVPGALALVSIIFTLYALRLIRRQAAKFTKRYAISRLIKTACNLALFAIILIWVPRAHIVPIIVVYLSTYFIYYLIEIVVLKQFPQKKMLAHDA